MFISQKSPIFDFNNLEEIIITLGQKKYSFWAKKEQSENIKSFVKQVEKDFEQINTDYSSFNQEQKIITLMFKFISESKNENNEKHYKETSEVVRDLLQEIIDKTDQTNDQAATLQ